MIGYCNKIKKEIISEADCYKCRDVDLTCCRYWRDGGEASLAVDRDKLQAEVEKWRANYETMLDGYEDVNNELQSMTARCKAADALIDKLLASYGAHIRRLIHGQPEYKTWLTLKKEAGE